MIPIATPITSSNMHMSLRRACFTSIRWPLPFSAPSHHLRRTGPVSQQLRTLKISSALKAQRRPLRGSPSPPRYFPSEEEEIASQRQQARQQAIHEEAARSLEQKLNRRSRSKQALIYALFAANTAVFVAWQYGKLLAYRANDPASTQRAHQWADFMSKNFVRSDENLQKGRWWTNLTSAISHANVIHFGINMWALRCAGTWIVGAMPQVSPLSFAALCLGSTMAASAGAQLSGSLTGDPRGGLGASGMLSGLLAAATCAFPQQLWMNTALWFAIDLGVLSTDLRHYSFIGHAAHLGGSVFGFLFYLVAIRRGRLPGRM